MKVSVACVLLVLSTSALFPVASSAQTYSPFQFLRTTYSARVAGLAEATVAAQDDPSNVILNPAAAYGTAPGTLTATFIKQVADINSGLISYSGSFSTGAKWAAHICYQSFGSFDGKDNEGNSTGKVYVPSSIVAGFSYANEIDSGFSYGVGINFMSATLADQSTTAFGLNAGVIYHIPNSRWNAGLSIEHLGTQISSINSVSEPLPTDLRLGVNHRLRGLPLLVNFSFNHLVDQNTALFDHFRSFSLGGELYVGKIIMLRLGYNNAAHIGSSFPVNSQFAGLDFGVGIKLKALTIDYALSSMISGVMQHRFSVQSVL